MSKFYFYDKDSEMCETLPLIKDRIKFDGLKEKIVTKAKMIVGDDVFYCKHFMEMGTVGEGCGKDCKFYQPRNGVNGRCTKSMNCYEPNEEILIKIK